MRHITVLVPMLVVLRSGEPIHKLFLFPLDYVGREELILVVSSNRIEEGIPKTTL